ncbi:hypothetical protein L6452_42872 [Arctium lappa]|uniref:Uncharacterized protein n=1 Tax=Arctium lappa TaxID=4217 RepID=A0ACB8XK84_ARCLA|nr:hypothetical protein L6452_42872 [Arctium lappa]
MGNSLRCCLSCLLPCGALDLIRIVHLNGTVEEINRPITAGEVLTNYPNHVLSKPSSHDVVRRIVILSSHSELKRGGIYFLIPASSVPENKRKSRRESSGKPVKIIKAVVVDGDVEMCSSGEVDLKVSGGVVAEKKVVHRSVDGGDWRPHLESIFEEQ